MSVGPLHLSSTLFLYPLALLRNDYRNCTYLIYTLWGTWDLMYIPEDVHSTIERSSASTAWTSFCSEFCCHHVQSVISMSESVQCCAADYRCATDNGTCSPPCPLSAPGPSSWQLSSPLLLPWVWLLLVRHTKEMSSLQSLSVENLRVTRHLVKFPHHRPVILVSSAQSQHPLRCRPVIAFFFHLNLTY